MFGFSGDGGRPSLIGTTVRAAAIVAGLSWLAAGWMASTTDRQTVAQLTGRATRGPVDDPITTGTITRQAGSTRIDPCVAAPRR